MSTTSEDSRTGRRGNGDSQRDQAYQRLLRLLILKQAQEGKRLRESEWAERLGVNRTALREAFARLAAEGLIDKGPVTGYFVPVLKHADLQEIVEVRIMLEGGAIRRICACGLNTPDRLAGMSQACEQLERLVREDYYLGVAEADRRYHEALVSAAGNKRLVMLYQRAPLPIIPPEVVSGSEWTARVQATLREHRAILATLLDGDAEQALQYLREHLRERFLLPLCAS